MNTYLKSLREKRDAIDEEIRLIEKGIVQASYNANMNEQLLTLNERRLKEGKRQISKTEFASGVLIEN